jgi:SagB-type dehydrogenase family enzyme
MKYPAWFFLVLSLLGVGYSLPTMDQYDAEEKPKAVLIKLPKPRTQSKTLLEEALAKRRTVREYRKEPLTLSDLSALLWSARGVRDSFDPGPSPQGEVLYPLELYLVSGSVFDLPRGVYKYRLENNELIKVVDGDKRQELSRAAFHQSWVRSGAVVIVIVAVYDRVWPRYGDRSMRYVSMEAGHVAEGVQLEAVSLGLGTVVVGAFDDAGVKTTVSLEGDEEPLCLIPVGKV